MKNRGFSFICFSVIHQIHAAFISWDAFDASDEKL
ncbi:MAG: hypothetical protein ACJAXM_000773 [Arenicella sp.]|jgi:hypothetical protein